MLVVTLFTLLLALSSWKSIAQNVVQLSTENFPEILSSENIVLVNYYAPWCGHCETLSPILDDVAREIHDLGLSAKVAKLDVSDEQFHPLVKHENITGYPTLLLYKQGTRLSEYQGHRTVKDILDYVKLKVGSASRYISNQDELMPFILLLENTQTFEQHNLLAVVLGLFVNVSSQDSLQQRISYKLYSKLALHYDLALFFHTFDQVVLDEFKATEDCLIVFTGEKHDTYHRIVLQNEVEDVTDHTAPTSSVDPTTSTDDASTTTSIQPSTDGTISDYLYHSYMDEILVQSLPVSIPYTSDTLPLLGSIPISSHVLIFYDAQGSDDSFVDMILAIGTKYKGQLLLIEVSSEEFSILQYFNLLPSDLPQLILVDMREEENPQRYHFIDYLLLRIHQGLDPYNPTRSSPLHPRANAGQDLQSQKFVMKRRISAEEEQLFPYNSTHVEAFFSGYLQKQIFPSVLSENALDMEKINKAIPINHNALGRLYVENIASMQLYEKLYNFPKTNMLIYFHAPWCIHCKALEPLIMDLADRLKEDPYFQIYRIDGSKNEINYPGFVVYGFPTLYLLPPVLPGPGVGDRETALQRKPVLFDGDRTIDELLQFVKSNRVDVVEYLQQTQVGDTENTNPSESDTEEREEIMTDSEQEETIKESENAESTLDTTVEVVSSRVEDNSECSTEGTCIKEESSEITEETVVSASENPADAD